MTRFVIRPPEEKDIQALADLCFFMWHDFYKKYVPNAFAQKWYTTEQCHQYQHDMLNAIQSTNKACALVAEDTETGKIAALCYINQNDQIEDNDLYVPGFPLELQHLYIWPEYRNKHIAGKLFHAILNWARQHKYQSLYWWVIDLNPFSSIHPKRGKVVKQMPRDYTGKILNLTAYGMEL